MRFVTVDPKRIWIDLDNSPHVPFLHRSSGSSNVVATRSPLLPVTPIKCVNWQISTGLRTSALDATMERVRLSKY